MDKRLKYHQNRHVRSCYRLMYRYQMTKLCTHSAPASILYASQQQPSCGSLIELDLLLDNNSKRVFSENFLSVSLVSWTSRASIIVDQLTKSTYIIYTIVMENSEENHSCDKNAGFATRALHTKLKP